MRNLKIFSLIIIFILFFNTGFSREPIDDIFETSGKLIEFISSDYFKVLKNTINPLELIDTIFVYSLKINDNDISESLLVCSLGTLTYASFYVNPPLFKIPIKINIFNEIDSITFRKFNENIPSNFFHDSPDGINSDIDKLTHFFSSAYLSYNFSEQFSDGIGIIVENFEETFEAQNRIDERDISMNRIGQEFGTYLKEKLIYPSEIINKYKNLKNG